jgi:Arsenical pump membrane protein
VSESLQGARPWPVAGGSDADVVDAEGQLANLLNNLPVTLVLVGPRALAGSPGLVRAVVLGVNIGPDLTDVGSLATLLWRRILRWCEHRRAIADFLRLGALPVPAGLLAGVAAVWLDLELTYTIGVLTWLARGAWEGCVGAARGTTTPRSLC